jgi:hypothetical protein
MFEMALVCCSGKLIVLTLAIGQKFQPCLELEEFSFFAAEGIIQCRELE